MASDFEESPKPHPPTMPETEKIEEALRAIVRKGLPVTPAAAPPVLLDLPGVRARTRDPHDREQLAAALNAFLRQILRRIPGDAQRSATLVLVGLGEGAGLNLTGRRRRAAAILGYEEHHFRKRVEGRLVRGLAWECFQDSLRYPEKQVALFPLAVDRHEAVLGALDEEIHRDALPHEILLARIMSDVHGIKAELLSQQLFRGDPKAVDEYEQASGGATWYMARLLTNARRYVELYGQSILLNQSEYTVEALIGLTGWTGTLSSREAQALRLLLAEVGEWDRAAFISVLPVE